MSKTSVFEHIQKSSISDALVRNFLLLDPVPARPKSIKIPVSRCL